MDTFLTDVLCSANETGSLKLDKAVADVLTSGEAAVFGVGTVALVSTIVLTEGVDTNFLSHVELVGNRGSAIVEPVAVIGCELMSAGGLGVLCPL